MEVKAEDPKVTERERRRDGGYIENLLILMGVL